MTYVQIPDSAIDAKSPLDEALFNMIKDNFDDLDGRVNAAGAFDYQFKLNGNLRRLYSTGLNAAFAARRRVDGAMISKSTTFTSCRLLLENPGWSGTIEIDIRRFTNPNVALTGLEFLYSDTINSVGRVGSSLNTQSVGRSTAQISTQSISRWKSQVNVLSVIPLNASESEFGDEFFVKNLVRINLSGTVDADWSPANSVIGVTIAGCTNAANDGQFAIIAYNMDGGNNIIITNASAVAQAGAAGTCDLDAWKFVYTNPVSTQYVAGEVATLASHTTPANNGAFTIYAINQGGNNIIFRGAAFVAQAGVAGNSNVNRWIYSLAAPAAADYVVGESILAASHTTGANNGTFPIRAVNSGGDNVIIYNTAGVVQAGAAGTINTCRWIYAFPSDPSSYISVGHLVWNNDATSSSNRGQFTVVEVNRSAGSNVVVHNVNGATQGSPTGTMKTSRVKLKFAADQSSYLTTSSRIAVLGLPDNVNSVNIDGEYDVVAVNFGGGSNYNAVVNMYLAASNGACGRVTLESKSLFDTKPSVAITNMAGKWCELSSNAVLNATQKIVPANTLVMMDITQLPLGPCANLTVQLL